MCLITVLPSLRPGPEPRPVRRRRERMNSLTHLREVVDVVIGVDTHVHTHSAAVVDAATGGVLNEVTVEATAEGYADLVKFANNHAMLRAWGVSRTAKNHRCDAPMLRQAFAAPHATDRPALTVAAAVGRRRPCWAKLWRMSFIVEALARPRGLAPGAVEHAEMPARTRRRRSTKPQRLGPEDEAH